MAKQMVGSAVFIYRDDGWGIASWYGDAETAERAFDELWKRPYMEWPICGDTILRFPLAKCNTALDHDTDLVGLFAGMREVTGKDVLTDAPPYTCVYLLSRAGEK